jgi:tetratricopeptide (TPR) repeat protein
VRATEADPGSVDYWLVRAETERDVGRIDEAKASWRRALAVGPGLSQAARVRVHRQLWEAEHPGRTVAPEAAEPFRREAIRLTGLRCYADALTQITLAIELDPCDGESWRSKGTALTFLGRREEAVDALRQAVDYGAGDALAPLARLLVALQRWAEARPVVARLMEIDSRNPEYRRLDARCLEVK